MADTVPTSHFFIQNPSTVTQTAAQGFGPFSENVFNVTSRFAFTAKTKAFAICKGVVLVQPNGTNLVNVILKPYNQPIPGLNIKYFVYRGLSKDEFFTTATSPTVIPKTPTTSDFINKINDDFDSYYANHPNDKPPFLAKYIGYDPARSVADLLDNCFFKQSEVEGPNETSAFELPLIDAGKSLGSFAIGVGGMDVILSDGSYKHNFDNGDFKFDLAYARSNNVTISVASGTALEKKIKKEQCLQFLDIAAFYGFFVKEGKVTSTNNGVVSEKKANQIYTDLLSPFATKNKWYLYLQSDRTRSYNFYGNYAISSTNTNNLKIGLQENALVEGTFGTNGWPMLINVQQAAPIAGNTNKNSLLLQFVTDNNVNTMLYGQIGTVENAQHNNFCNADALVLPADAQGNPSRLTKIIKLSNPAVVEANQSKNIAGFTLLHYRGVRYAYKAGEVVNENNESVPVYAEANFFDDVFDLIDSKSLFNNSENSLFSKMTSERLSLVNHYFNRTQLGISAVQTVAINDSIATGIEATPQLQRVTYLTEAVDVMNNPVAVSGSISSDTKTAPASSGNAGVGNLFQLEAPYFYEIKVFTDRTTTVSGLLLKTLDGSVPNRILLGITKAENEALKVIISSTPSIKNPRIFLIDLFEDGNELISPENITYQKYKVGLVMENSLGLLELKMPASDILVYSLDRKYHFSKEYSQHMTKQQTFTGFSISYQEILY